MKGAFALLLLIALSAWSQPIYRNFFTTNPAPVVQVTAGTNVTITFTLTGTDTRTYKVDIPYQTWLTNGFPWGVLYDPLGAASAATNGYPWTNIALAYLPLTGGIVSGPVQNTNTSNHNWSLYNASQEVRSNYTTGNWSRYTNATALWTNPTTGAYVYIDGTASTISLGGSNIVQVVTNAGTLAVKVGNAVLADTASALSSSATLTQAQVSNSIPPIITNAVSQASFTPFVNAGTNIIISPTNGNYQSWQLTNASWAQMAAATTNWGEIIRLDIFGSNTLTWTTTTLSNSANLGPSNLVSSIIFDHPVNTNLWWGYRLR